MTLALSLDYPLLLKEAVDDLQSDFRNEKFPVEIANWTLQESTVTASLYHRLIEKDVPQLNLWVQTNGPDLVIYEGATVKMLVEVKRLFRFGDQEQRACKKDMRSLEGGRRDNRTVGQVLSCGYIVFDVGNVLHKKVKRGITVEAWLRQLCNEASVELHLISNENKANPTKEITK